MMQPIDFENDTDDLLDRALASYTPVTPRLGLEDRVRAQFSAPALPARRLVFFSWNWAIPGAISAAIILALLLRSHSPSGPQISANNQVESSIAAKSPETEKATSALPAHSHQNRRTLTLRTHTHQPTQQQLIAQLLANGPEVIASLARAEEEQQKPIEIKPLTIEPLVIDQIQIKPIDEKSAKSGGAL